MHKTERCRIALPEVLGRNAFDLDRILEIEPEFLGRRSLITMITTTITIMITTTTIDHDHHHHDGGGLKHYHDEEMQSVSLRTDKPLDPGQVLSLGAGPRAEGGAEHPALQGHPVVQGRSRRFVFQGVHMILDGDHQRPWKDGEKR